MTLREFRDILLTLGIPTYHYDALKQTDKYIVWAEDNELRQLKGNNKVITQVIQGTLDYFTKKEFDTNVDRIQNLFNAHEIPFRLNLIDNEPDTGYIHYEWIWEVANG